MIRLKRNRIDAPVVVTMELAGQPFEIELLPFPEKDWIKELEPFRKKKNVPNPITKKMDMITYFDDDNAKYQEVVDNLLDRIVVTFAGIAGEDGVELDGTKRENKIMLGAVKVDDFEEIPIQDEEGSKGVIKQRRTRRFSSLIFDKAMELASVTAEAEIKN